jgi:hypothetical protein
VKAYWYDANLVVPQKTAIFDEFSAVNIKKCEDKILE